VPGLVGIVWNKKVDDMLLDKMANSIKHEEWHKVDKYCDPFFSAARVDLGIFNPEPQPIFNEDRTIGIFMYGKVYDYDKEASELRSRGHQFAIGNDAEFCLHSYEEYGTDFVQSLNGSFVLIIYDLKQAEVTIVNDRYGLRPLYYNMSDGKLLFASEVKAILEVPAFDKKLNEDTIAEFFAFGEILGNKTFFEGIETLPPASVLTYDGKRISIKQYWDPDYEPDYSLSQDEIAEQLVQAFRKAVDIRMRDNLRYGVSLSGGLDSRVVLAAIDKSQRHRVTTFTFGVSGCDEIKIAKMVAREAGVSHRVIELVPEELVSYAEEVVHLSDGMDTIDVTFIPYFYNRAREQVDVFSNGTGLDILLGGLFLNRLGLNARTTSDLVVNYIDGRLLNGRLLSDKAMSNLFVPDYYRRFKEDLTNSVKEAFEHIGGERAVDKWDRFVLQNHMRRFTILGSVIARNKIEDAPPGLDNNFINLVSQIPLELRFNHRIYREFLTKLAPELAAMNYNHTMVRADAPLFAWRIGGIYQYGKERIKKEIWRLTRGKIYLPNKRNYINLDEWLRLNKKWRGFIMELLLDEKARSRDYFNKAYIETLMKEQETGKVDHSRWLVYLATFELFLRMFIDS